MEKTKIYVGDIFYTPVSENEVMLLRITKIINENKYGVITSKGKFNISYDNLIEKYTKLKPHGSIFFSIVNTGDTKDVVISFFRRNDEGKLPYAVCRQNMENVFMTKGRLMNKKQDGLFDIGVSISQDTCPEDIDFNMMLICNNVLLSTRINVYLNDTFEDIINLIPKKNKFDAVLKELYDKTIGSNLVGLNENVEDLMANTGFMQDVCSGFNIRILPDVIEFDQKTNALSYDQCLWLQNEINYYVQDVYAFPYDFNISLNKIKRTYTLVKDKNEDVYIVMYTEGEPIRTNLVGELNDIL